MRNGFLGSFLLLFAAVPGASPQSPPDNLPPSSLPGFETPWQPPRTDTDDRPNAGPAGYRFYGSVDYILWWTEKDRPVSPLLANPLGTAGNLTQDTDDPGALLRNGGRAALGMWLNQQQSVGLEMGGFWVNDRTPSFNGQGDDLATRTQLRSELWGGEAQLRAEAYRGTWAHFDVLAGFSFLSLGEGQDIDVRDFDTNDVTSDRFGTRNRFYGGHLGGEMELHYAKWLLDTWGKAALGVNDETIDINGTTLAGGQAFPGGQLASPAIDGQHRRDQFAVVPSVGFNVGYEFGQHLRLTAGYTFLYLSNAARPGAQIDALLQAPHLAPFPFSSGSFWVQGLNVGLEFRF